jgi:hypothetical protein
MKKVQISKIRDEILKTQEITDYHQEICCNLYSNKLGNLEETNKFLDSYYLPKLTQENVYHVNIAVRSKIET